MLTVCSQLGLGIDKPRVYNCSDIDEIESSTVCLVLQLQVATLHGNYHENFGPVI